MALLVRGPAFQVLQAAGNLIWLGAVVVWVMLLARSWRGETWRVPLAGDLAEKIAGR